jgi:hypothetical protein
MDAKLAITGTYNCSQQSVLRVSRDGIKYAFSEASSHLQRAVLYLISARMMLK